ncbi:tigger transposable element-derived protein 6-like [Hydra vulgaris]|uniref:tigger transposable element-derived protein 6-like n=1 Tax=Hydra vulgaris TaxID=6087 RepID=UPI001F5F9983|nr:tigger transposable element-derived protein 6-like [Hydra vulgaris]
MDSVLFEEWIQEMDKKFTKEKKKVVFIIDNCPAHPTVDNLKSIELIFLPPNTGRTTAEDVVFADECLISTEPLLTDKQLVEEVKNAANEHDGNDEEDNDDDNAINPVCPKVSDIWKALKMLYGYMPFSLMDKDLQQKLNAVSIIFDKDVSSKLKQSDIRTFFNL